MILMLLYYFAYHHETLKLHRKTLIRFCFVFSLNCFWALNRESASVFKDSDRRGENVSCVWIKFTSICLKQCNDTSERNSRNVRRVPTPFGDGMCNLKLQDASGSVVVGRMISNWCHGLHAPPTWWRAIFLCGDMWKIQNLCLLYVDLPELQPGEFLYVSVKFRDDMSNNRATIKLRNRSNYL